MSVSMHNCKCSRARAHMHTRIWKKKTSFFFLNIKIGRWLGTNSKYVTEQIRKIGDIDDAQRRKIWHEQNNKQTNNEMRMSISLDPKQVFLDYALRFSFMPFVACEQNYEISVVFAFLKKRQKENWRIQTSKKIKWTKKKAIKKNWQPTRPCEKKQQPANKMSERLFKIAFLMEMRWYLRHPDYVASRQCDCLFCCCCCLQTLW